MQRSNTDKIKFYVNDESKRLNVSFSRAVVFMGEQVFYWSKKGEALAGFTLHWFYVKRWCYFATILRFVKTSCLHPLQEIDSIAELASKIQLIRHKEIGKQ